MTTRANDEGTTGYCERCATQSVELVLLRTALEACQAAAAAALGAEPVRVPHSSGTHDR